MTRHAHDGERPEEETQADEREPVVLQELPHRGRSRLAAAPSGVGGSPYGPGMDVEELDGPGGGWRVLIPETRRERMRGLRGHPPPGPREAMLFRRCRSVQTFGLEGAILVVFLDRAMRVIGIRRCRPGRLVASRRRARHVLECDVRSELRIGDRFRPTGPTGP